MSKHQLKVRGAIAPVTKGVDRGARGGYSPPKFNLAMKKKMHAWATSNTLVRFL